MVPFNIAMYQMQRVMIKRNHVILSVCLLFFAINLTVAQTPDVFRLEYMLMPENSGDVETSVIKNSNKKDLFETIDTSLEKYRISLDKVVQSVNCKDATAFASRIYAECEAQLLKPNISEGSKYYNLRTKEITAEALTKIGDCSAAK